jgi:hypothetical protein
MKFVEHCKFELLAVKLSLPLVNQWGAEGSAFLWVGCSLSNLGSHW